MTFSIKNIYKSFNQKMILNNISYDFSDAVLYIIKGKSGSGKTILLSVLAGYENCDHGEIINDSQLKITNIYQSYELIDSLNVEENISINEDIGGYTYQYKQSVIEALQLESLLNHYPDELSLGQKQRVGIARALVSQNDVFLCDEPTESLDYTNIQKVMLLLKELSKRKIIIMVTHNLEILDIKEATILNLDNGLLTVEREGVRSSFTKTENKFIYQSQVVKKYTQRILKKKSQSQMLTMLICVTITFLMMFIYDYVFVKGQFDETINKNIIYIEW